MAGAVTTFTYREDNLLNSKVDARGVETLYIYDRGKRVTRIQAGNEVYGYVYDNMGRIISASSSGAASVSYEYDAMGRVISETIGRTTVEFEYNNEGELTTESLLGEDRLYSYDARGLLASMTTPSGTHSYAYDAIGQLISHTLPNGLNTTMKYDASGALIEQDHSIVGGSNWQYTRDELGRLVQSSGSGTDSWLYQHDTIGRLTNATGPQSYNYEYDARGNRINSGEQYDAFNKLLENNDYLFTYNEVGGLTSRVNKFTGAETRYRWNGMQRLEAIEIATEVDARAETTIQFEYDAFGRRVQKSVDRDITNYRWSGDNMIAEFGNSSIPNAVYRYDGGVTAAEYTDDNNTYFVLPDYLGSTQGFVGSDGSYIDASATDPYGAMLGQSTEGPEFNQGFPGQYLDRESGLAYNHHRYYDPSIGRYLNSDPIGPLGGLNAYQYAASNPVMYMDVFGLKPTGTWVQRPTLSRPNLDFTGWNFTLDWNWWGYVELVTIHGRVSGTLSASVRCTDTDDCGNTRQWTVSGSANPSYSGSINIGPNLYAALVGIRFGIYGSIAANIAIIIARLGYNLSSLYSAYGEIAVAAHREMVSRGPDAICQSGF